MHFKGVDVNQKVGEQAFEVDQKVSVWGKLMGRPKTRGKGRGQSFKTAKQSERSAGFQANLYRKKGLIWFGFTPLSTIFQLYRESVLFLEETGGPGENHRPDVSH